MDALHIHEANVPVTRLVTAECHELIIPDVIPPTEESTFPEAVSIGMQLIKSDSSNECEDLHTNRGNQLKQLPENIRGKTRPFKCPQCNAAYTQSSSLWRHAFSHSDAKPYSCKECGKSYKRRDSLNEHYTSHIAVNPYKCKICGDVFKSRGSLYSHTLFHNNAKPFKCDDCGAEFTTRGNLKIHGNVHNNVRPFACDSCEARFGRTSDLRRHQQSHTGEKRHQCEVCGACYAQKCTLRRHVLNAHNPEKCETATLENVIITNSGNGDESSA